MRPPKNRLQELAQNIQHRQAQTSSFGQEQPQGKPKPGVEAKPFDQNQPITLQSSGQGQQGQSHQKATVEAMAFDHNEPIELGYNPETGGYEHSAPTYATAHSVEPVLNFGSEAFEVESFDAEPSAVADAPAPVQPEVAANQSQPMPIKSATPPTQSFSVEDSPAPKPAAPQDVATADDFLEDLNAILNGEKTYNGNTKQVANTSPHASQLSIANPLAAGAESATASAEPSKQTSPHEIFDRMAQGISLTPTPSTEPTYSNAHSIFDRMGKNMAYANSFDLGTISLQQRFDEFDQKLDTEKKEGYSKRLDEFDRMLDAEEESTVTVSETTKTTESESQYTASLSESDRSVPYHSYLYHLDLCILAYQLYNQTLIWPLDPWYERPGQWWAIARRSALLKAVHQFKWQERVTSDALYSGPNNTRRDLPSNENLDPIITVLNSINPKQIAVSRDDSRYRVFQAPSIITDSIHKVFLCYYADPKKRPSSRDLAPSLSLDLNEGNPTIISIQDTSTEEKLPNCDELYAFEGGTGLSNYNLEHPAWSLMGYVLKQYQDDGQYNVRIVFRGSQSGSANRAIIGAQLANFGNPDWVTDMNVSLLIKDLQISSDGEVCQGFKDGVRICLNTITKCLETIAQTSDSRPANISVAGHSLGGALAAQFCGAVLCGAYGGRLKEHPRLQHWTWDSLQLLTFGAPVVGDATFATSLTKKLKVSQRVWVKGDIVTSTTTFPLDTKKAHVGKPLELPKDFSEMDKSYSPGIGGDDNVHEPMMIRFQLLKRLYPEAGEKRLQLWRQPPWRKYVLFKNLYDEELPRGQEMSFIQALLGSSFIAHIDIYVELIAQTLWTEVSKENLRQAFNFSVHPEYAIDDRLQLLRGIISSSGAGKAEEYLRLCLCLKAICMGEDRLLREISGALTASDDNRIKRCFSI